MTYSRRSDKMPTKTDQFTGLTGSPYIGVTRAHVRAQTADRGIPVRPVNDATVDNPDRPKRTILALDLGTTTGWAIRDHTSLITSGTVSFKPSRYDGGGMRYLRFTNWLTEIDRLSGPIEAIYFEEVRRHVGTDAAHVFGGLLAVLTSWGELRGVPYQGVPVGTIKRHATGKGNANKQAMIDAACARGFSPADDNEADAIAILLWAIETQGGAQ
jgi:Holliday junction resolvasome RuvABC endonuclease subunit